MLSCGLDVIGYAKYKCSNDKCDHQKKVAFSCKSRFCPTCGKKSTDQWILVQREVLPQTKCQHITLTMPGELWCLFKFSRNFLKHLSRIAGKILNKEAKKKGVLVGIFTALHTFGRDLKWNVHVHVSVTAGGLSLDHSKWKGMYFVSDNVMKMWRYEIITLLRKNYKLLELPEELKKICGTKKKWNNWLNEHNEKFWKVHLAHTTDNVNHNVNYLGRYIKRPPLSQSRLKHYDGKEVMFNFLNHKTGKHEDAVYETEEFIERLTQHIPDKGFRMINYYGFLAQRVRAQLLPKVYALLDQVVKEVKQLKFRFMQKKSFGCDPLICIMCGSEMRYSGLVFGKSFRELKKYHRELATLKIVR
jgi:Putative transposase/Transposase zinc-binding domain